MKKVVRLLGIIILLAAFIASLQYALTDYGVRDNALAQDVLDQTNSANH